MSDNTANSSANYVLLTRLADEFAARYRAGERPALKEYIDRYPELADEIHELFPAMVEIEQVKEDRQDATDQAAAPAFPALEQVGDFRIIREVGKGGMGIVYEAEQVSLGRHVALKVLPKNMLLDANAKRRFQREAKSAAKLHHTNIVPVFGVGEQDGMPYYVMQFIQGLGLDEVLEELKKLQHGNVKTGTFAGGERRVSRKEISAVAVARSLMTGDFQWTSEKDNEDTTPATEAVASRADQTARAAHPPALSDSFTLSSSSVVLPGQRRDGSKSKGRRKSYWRSVAQIGVQVADALEYAHKQGVHHRDVKPSNLLLDTQATVWVTDFGLAKANDQPNLTHTGDILGTLRYMPPEAFEGKTDARSDVYSLGLTLYEMLAFRPAFDEKERNRLIKQVTSAEPARLGKLNRQVPQDLETIVHKAIDKDATQRYPSAGALAEDLQRFIDDEPIKARRVGQTERLWRWCRRNPVVAGLTAALLLVFLAGFAGVAWKWQEAERQKGIAHSAEQKEAAQRQIAEEQADLAKDQADLATREADRSRRLLYASDMSLAYQAWEAADTGRARNLLEEQRPRAGQEDLRGFEWRYLWSLCQDGSRQTLRGHTSGFRQVNVARGDVVTVAFTPDGKTLATCEWDNSVRIWDVASGRHVKVLVSGLSTSVAFAPDGKTLAIGELTGRAVRLWDVAAHCERATIPHPTWVWSVAVSPDGKLLATGCEDRTVRIWDVATRQEVGILRGHTGPPWHVAFSPDGRTLASGSFDATVRLWDVAARRLIVSLQGHTKWVTALSFSPDGKLLASASADSTVRLWDTATKQAVKTLREPRTVLNSVVFSPDGKTLATGGGDGTVRVWDAVTMEVATLLRGHTAPVTAVAFAPDARSLVSASRDGTVKVWDATAGQNPNTLSGHKYWLTALAVSPDGKTLAVSDADEHDHTVKLWDLASRQPAATLKGHKEVVLCVTFAPDGQTLASGGVDKTVRLWDVGRKEQVAEFQHEGYVGWADLSPDGKLLAAGTVYGETGRVWDLTTRREVAQLNPASRVRFTPDAMRLAASSGNTVRLWDVATWQKAVEFTGHAAEVISIAFAPDGRTIAVGDAAGTLRLWDVAQKRQIASRRGHASEVGDVAFAPDGRRLATSGGDSTVKLWDAALLREVASLTCRDTLIDLLAFAPDGNTLATGGSDGTVRLWQAPASFAGLRETADAPIVAPVKTLISLLSLELNGSAQATLSPERNAQRVDVTAVDDTSWHAQLTQLIDDLQEGATYKVRFRAKANVPRSIGLAGNIGEPDWHGIGLYEAVPLSKDWQAFQYEFRAKDLAAWNMIQFHVGQRTGTVWIADVTLTKGEK